MEMAAARKAAVRPGRSSNPAKPRVSSDDPAAR